MKRPTRLGLAVLVLLGACTSSSASNPPASSAPALQPGEICDPSTAPAVVIHFDPPSLIVAPGESRPVRVIVDPDMCVPLTASLAVKDPAVATAPPSYTFDLRHPTFDLQVQALPRDGGLVGPVTTTLDVSLPLRPADSTHGFAGDTAPSTGCAAGKEWCASLPIEVRDPALPACPMKTSQSAMLSSSMPSLTLPGGSGASLAVPPGAFTRTDELALPPFQATLACAPDLVSGPSYVKLGPAVTFTPSDPTDVVVNTHSLRRELDFAVPVNPADMPQAARMRHVVVFYAGPRAHEPRPVTVANPTFEKLPSGNWVLHFEAPWFGTYQAAALANGGTVLFHRHLTHRAVLGISMGGGGAAIFGMRHHDQFDAIAPLGGNSDLTWLVWYFEQFKFGGFCTAANPKCTIPPPNLYPLNETYAHTEDFDHWFFQPGGGTGGSFSRGDWTQILEDFSMMGGNPNGQNGDPAIPFMVVGPKSTDPFVAGTVPGVNCAVTIDPIGPNSHDSLAMQMQEQKVEMQQQQVQTECLASRCDPKNAWVAKTGFYDADYNPDGSKPVISFCDGGQDGMSPYVDTWAPMSPGSGVPSNLTLAVDLNGNGARDLGEPVIRQGHEPFTDTGTDGVPDALEPGYDPVNNLDPNGDDYDFQLNPNGTEGDHVWEQGEPFEDVGLDGVPNTPQQSQGGYDVGEGNGKFDLSAGAERLLSMDPHSILHGRATAPGGPLDEAALERMDVWADGGVRDMANFAAVGNHLIGAFASALRSDGTRVKSSAFYDNFENLPGADPSHPDQFLASQVQWADVASAAHLRYGHVDATPTMIAQGDGQHVGTGSQILYRLVTGFYFVASKWPDADRTMPASLDSASADAGGNVETTTKNELGTACEIAGHCETYFTGRTSHRTGPIAVTLPPGYALEANRERSVTYPVLYVLHGYGQDPRDLEATAAITVNYEDDALKSSADRLAKMIVVYVDGRCRIDPTTNAPECIRGTFYMNGDRNVNGHAIGQLDDWFEEVMQYVDQNYRTMPASDVDVVE